MAIDAANGLLHVAHEATDNLSVLNATTLHLVSTIYTGFETRGLALDPHNGRLFVANDYTSNISAINTLNPSVLITIYTAGYSYTLQDEFDPATGQL
jgi:DNA-binding beta-propeller fold protein YncE